MKYNTLLIFLFFLSANACPWKEDLYPCTCEWPNMEGKAFIHCSKIDNDHDLTTSAKTLIGKNYVYSFTIEDSAFNYIPSDAFKGLKFFELEIKDSTLMSLTDTDIAFDGLEDYLEIIRMDRCNVLNQWEWSLFRNLKKLNTIEITEGTLESIEDLGKINLENLKTVSFSDNKIDFIHEKAFSGCQKLVFVTLNDNRISSLKRTMFPNPASELLDINLNNNKIEELPDDIFSNMPKLKSIRIFGNKILVIAQEVFASVWGQLELFEARRNEIRCDCRMTWILHTKMPENVHATCFNPQALKGISVESLTSKDLYCFH